MNNRTVGFLGSGLLAVGTMTPIVSMPFVGTLNYLMNGKGDGMVVLALAAVSALLVAFGAYRGLWLTAGVAAAISLYSLFNFISLRAELEAKVAEQLAGNPFAGLAQMMVQTVQLQWGWIVIFAGIMCLMVAAARGVSSRFGS